jgi:aldose 1-epimerase
MRSAEAKHFQVYSPASGGFFVAEPVSHANAALNAPEEEWAQLGMRILAPGEKMRLAMRIAILPVRRFPDHA